MVPCQGCGIGQWPGSPKLCDKCARWATDAVRTLNARVIADPPAGKPLTSWDEIDELERLYRLGGE